MEQKIFIFDFDGTLVDSMPHWSAMVLNILDTYKVSYPEDIIKILTPLGNLGAAKYFQTEMGIPLTLPEITEMMEALTLPKYRDVIPLKPGVFECLQKMKAAGYSLNVLTASPHRTLDPCLQRNGVWELFDYIWSCEDFGTTKSDPDIYVQAAAKLGVTVQNAVFVDDNIGAVKTAAQAGMRTIGVYDPSGADFKAQLQAAADHYIDSFDQLAQMI